MFGIFSKKNNENKNDKLNIKSLSGVLELNPAEQIEFNKMKKRIAETFEKYGFIPLDVATIERENVLLAKVGGDTEKEIYRIKKGDNDLALRFDLTVPLARYTAANYNDITFPFRRYQIGKVFRGERPQKGRFRELYQCDIDIIGDGSLDIKNDAEIPSIIYSIFSKLNIGPFVIKINNRKILSGMLEGLDLSDKTTEVLRAIDKFAKTIANKSPRTHEIPVEFYFRSANTTGALNINLAGMDKDQILANADKAVEKAKANLEESKVASKGLHASFSNPDLYQHSFMPVSFAQVRALIDRNLKAGYGAAKVDALVVQEGDRNQTDWDVKVNAFGVPVSRSGPGYYVAYTGKEGNCYHYYFYIFQKYEGGKYGATTNGTPSGVTPTQYNCTNKKFAK